MSDSEYGGFLANKETEWLDKFRNDRQAVCHALDTWQLQAKEAYYQLLDVIEFEDPRYLNSPAWFHNLTKIVALWCDTVLHIDPSPLVAFAGYVADTEPRTIVQPDGDVKRTMRRPDGQVLENHRGQAMACFDRVWHATMVLFSSAGKNTAKKSKPQSAKYRPPKCSSCGHTMIVTSTRPTARHLKCEKCNTTRIVRRK